MKSKKRSNNSRTTIISIIILDLILMSLFLFFSGQILKDFQNSSNLSTIVISSFAIVIPGTLVILIFIQFHHLLKNKYRPGNNFKKNIVIYFIITIFLVVIPQSFISINLIKTSTDNWLNNRVKQAVEIGFNMALDIENQNRKSIISLSRNKIFSSVIKNLYIDKQITISEINTLNSLISSIELFTTDGEPIIKIGNDILYINNLDKLKINSFYPKAKRNSFEVLYYQYLIQDKIVVLSHILPKNFTKNGTLLTSVKNSLLATTPRSKDISFGMFIYYLLFSIPLILLAILGCFIFSDEIVKPLKDIEEAIRSVAHGNYSYRILSKKKNEFNILINSFNNMIKEIEKSRNKLKHTEQISTWQDIATRLAHEIRNPLTPIKLSAQRVLLKESGKTDNKVNTKHMETIIKEVTRMEKLLNEFRDFARFPQLKIENVSVKTTIDEAINIYKTTYPNILFDLTGVEDIYVDIDKSQIIQVISNLTINGIHAMESSGIIQYVSETVQKKGQEICRLSIKDNGHGISKEIIPNIFKPYFTTKYNGSGLGLAIVNKIILDHKGKIWIESAVEVGTTFYFEFPKEAL